MPDKDLLVRILGDDRDLQRAIRNTDRSLSQIDKRTATYGRNISRAFGAAGIALGTATVFEGLNASIDAASNLSEQIARSNQVFEENAASVQKWSQDLAESFGIAQAQGLEFAGTFGLLFRNLGVSTGEAEIFSRQLVELAADLASFNNTDVDTALNALRSGLTGEIEPLRRFGVFLSEARSNTEALAQSGKTSTDALTTQEKVLARLNIILADTVRAQGDFARTSDGLANQQRKLRAGISNLSASFGGLLVPRVLETVGAVNDLIGAFQDLRDAIPGGGSAASKDFFGELFSSLPAQLDAQVENLRRMGENIDLILQGKGFEKRPSDTPFTDLGEAIADDLKRAGEVLEASLPETTRIAGAVQGSVDALVGAIESAREKLLKAQRVAARLEAKRVAQEWDEFVQGMELKFNTAQLSSSTADDIAALRELEAAILRRIEAEGRTFKLVSLLVSTRLRINALVTQAAADAKQAGEDAFNAAIDALDLDLEMAQATKGLADDQAALRAIEQAILQRIAVEGETTDLLRQLFNVRQQQAQVAQQLRDQKQEDFQGDIFERLGLTREGEERVPGGAALRKRARNLLDMIKDTALDTEKNRRILNGIINTTNKEFRQAGRAVRQAALGLLNDIDSAFDQNDKKRPLTKTSGLNTKKVLEGLGLTPEQINELRGRLSSVNTAGKQLANIQSNVPGGNFGTGAGSGAGAVVLTSTVNVNLDGTQIAKVVTKQQQKTRRRNPQQKRGPNRNR